MDRSLWNVFLFSQIHFQERGFALKKHKRKNIAYFSIFITFFFLFFTFRGKRKMLEILSIKNLQSGLY